MEIYRANVGICIINKDGLIFAGKRIGICGVNAWQMPQGGVDSLNDEKILLEGMYRELFEETGLLPKHVEILKKSEKVRYKFPPEIIAKNKQNKFPNIIGQEQIWFYLKFLGEDSDISLINDDHPEFSEWKWVSSQFLIQNIIEMKKEIYNLILKMV